VSPADLGVTITPSSASPLVGDPLAFTITAFSGGPAAANNVRVTGTLPGNVRFVGVTGGTISFVGNVYTIVLGQVAANSSASATLIVSPTATGPIQVDATVLSDNLDPIADNNTATSTVNAINLAGTFGLDATSYVVNENAGAITITIRRTNGTLGAVSVSFATADITAQAGLNYVATSGTVNFADGQTTATITIPVLVDNLILARSLTFGVALTPSRAAGIIDRRPPRPWSRWRTPTSTWSPPTVTSIRPVIAADRSGPW
jgi:uncharacterized repeat protein (TIGR01451 family)